MATIAVLVIMAGCAAHQYLKGNFVRAFATLMAALCAGIIAFAYFEQLAGLLIQQEILVNWAHLICFAVLFFVAFAILQTIVTMLTREPIDLGVMPERVGRIVVGLLLGLIISGLLLTAAAIAPLSNQYPYQRFDASRPDTQNSNKPLFNPDGFVSRLFGIISNGSLSGNKSFAVLHAGFIDQLFLNRHLTDKKVSTVIDPGALEVPAKAAAWPAPEGLKDSKGNSLSPQSGHDLIMVRIGLTAKLLKAGGSFTPGQLRLICNEKGEKNRLQGSAEPFIQSAISKSSARSS